MIGSPVHTKRSSTRSKWSYGHVLQSPTKGSGETFVDLLRAAQGNLK